MIRLHAISRRDGGEHDGIHLLWSPPFPSGHSIDGFTVYRRDALGRKDQYCFALSMAQLEQARTHGHLTVADATVWARPDANSTSNRGRWTYRVVLNRRHSQITVSGGPALAVFAGLADGTVIAGTGFVAPSVTLRGSDIGVLWLVSDNTKNEFQICGDVLRESSWKGARVIVKNLQVPFASVNSALSSVSDEQALAKSRAEPDAFAGEFDEISRYANAALTRPMVFPPGVWWRRNRKRTAMRGMCRHLDSRSFRRFFRRGIARWDSRTSIAQVSQRARVTTIALLAPCDVVIAMSACTICIRCRATIDCRAAFDGEPRRSGPIARPLSRWSALQAASRPRFGKASRPDAWLWCRTPPHQVSSSSRCQVQRFMRAERDSACRLAKCLV
jgi:hypothetical protein